jgi:hypothetical protein
VLPHESMTGSIATEAFRASGLDHPHTNVFTNSPEVRISLLTTSLRFPTRRSEIKVLPVKLPAAHVTNGIVTLKNRTLGPVARLFVEQARELAKPLAKRNL